MIFWIISGLSGSIAYFLLMRHYRRLWTRIPDSIKKDFPFLNLIIAFRNEERHLGLLCHSLNELDYPISKLQIIFVDDHSTDRSVNIIEQAKLKYGYKMLSLAATSMSGKKAAINEAWKYADADIVVQTDADCRFGKDWLGSMAGMFLNKKIQFVSGPVQFIEKPSFFNRITALDFSALIVTGAAHIAWDRPLMCNGANLAYRKKAIEHIFLLEAKTSGDDVYLIQHIHQQYKEGITFCKSRSAIVETEGPENIPAFWQQRLRWAAQNDKQLIPFNLLVLIFIWSYNLMILLSVFTFSKIGLMLALYMILMKTLAEFIFFEKTASFFQIKKWQSDLVSGQIFHVVYMAVLPIISKFISFKWKGREHRK